MQKEVKTSLLKQY